MARPRPVSTQIRRRLARSRPSLSRGYKQIYSTVLAELWVRSTAEPRQAAEVVARDLKACADATDRWNNAGWKQFETCMTPRGYAVTLN